jgi:hypothetical protein
MKTGGAKVPPVVFWTTPGSTRPLQSPPQDKIHLVELPEFASGNGRATTTPKIIQVAEAHVNH